MAKRPVTVNDILAGHAETVSADDGGQPTGEQDFAVQVGLRPQRDPYRQAAGFLLGTAAGGMLVNLLSASIGYRGVAVVALAAGLIAMAGWLRRLPRRAPITLTATSSTSTAGRSCLSQHRYRTAI